ncbi:hypothetical protein [Arcticibacter svalbardensis]|nr:hypothetical protein [Arcticibacter svalbardensis]
MIITEDEFELNLLFDKKKNPKDAFLKISDAFNCLNMVDDYYLSLADNSLIVSYELTNLEFSSIKSKIAQIIREIPDEAIRDFDWKKLLGHFLLKVKYRLLRFLEETQEVNTVLSIETLLQEVEVDKKLILGKSDYLLHEASFFVFLNLIEKLISSAKKLSDDERLEYKTEFGTVRIDNRISFNRDNIFSDLGNKSLSNETTEILKIKSTDFLSSEKMWAFKLNNKSINARITDHNWLRRYYQRDFPLLPNDSLKVRLKVTYSTIDKGEIYAPHYEITEVIDVIYPENLQMDTLF